MPAASQPLRSVAKVSRLEALATMPFVSSRKPMKKLVFRLVSLYRANAPSRLRNSCRFTPTCSEYMLMAVEKYGVLRGVAMGVRRICRCHPPNGGIDLP